ncbi:MAG: hypothetical protein NTV92_09445 [Candidatus Bipolaricaulota bacterium]|nr:hypothetical protein [Candidatus Bipolaricaulota bacterium]
MDAEVVGDLLQAATVVEVGVQCRPHHLSRRQWRKRQAGGEALAG